ncbi:MAG: alpha/beta hydrolase, partial [candidate division Zixibacteria bacterium]|nr:alpha/beta hydrolase [candidate division Zixibacteria bacterium]
MENRRTLHIEIDGEFIAINARVQGDGPIILFIHGWLASTHVWRDVFDRLPASYRLIAIDLPGFGETAPLHNGPITISHYATVIGRIADTLSTEGTIALMVADSLGAIAVLNLMKIASLPTGAMMLSGCPIDGLPKGIAILKRKGVVKNTLRVLRALPTKAYHRLARIYSRVIWNNHRPFEQHLADGARAAEPGTAENLVRQLFTPFPLDTPVMNQ